MTGEDVLSLNVNRMPPTPHLPRGVGATLNLAYLLKMSMGFMNGPAQELQSDSMVLSGNYAAGMTARPPPERWTVERVPLSPIPPQCPSCGQLASPGVIWFGESIDKDVLKRSLASTDCDVFLSIGTSGLVYPAASLTKEAKLRGALTIEINPEDTPHTEIVDARFRSSAVQILTAIEDFKRTS
jgi:hypothetical protein